MSGCPGGTDGEGPARRARSRRQARGARRPGARRRWCCGGCCTTSRFDALARKCGQPAAAISAWREDFLAAGREDPTSRPRRAGSTASAPARWRGSPGRRRASSAADSALGPGSTQARPGRGDARPRAAGGDPRRHGGLAVHRRGPSQGDRAPCGPEAVAQLGVDPRGAVGPRPSPPRSSDRRSGVLAPESSQLLALFGAQALALCLVDLVLLVPGAKRLDRDVELGCARLQAPVG
jgi:hypothetical protein